MHASKIMVPNRRGLIVNISSVGGVAYFQTAAYGIGKNGVSIKKGAENT